MIGRLSCSSTSTIGFWPLNMPSMRSYRTHKMPTSTISGGSFPAPAHVFPSPRRSRSRTSHTLEMRTLGTVTRTTFLRYVTSVSHILFMLAILNLQTQSTVCLLMLSQADAAQRVAADVDAAFGRLDAGMDLTGDEQRSTFARMRNNIRTVIRALTCRGAVDAIPPALAPRPPPRPSTSSMQPAVTPPLHPRGFPQPTPRPTGPPPTVRPPTGK